MKQLMEAYHNTNYLAYINPKETLCININQFHPTLDRLLELHQAETWAYITAWNPFSQPLSLEENQVRNQDLENKLQGKTYFKGKGVAKKADWSEESYLILDFNLEEAKKLGQVFEQNAILAGRKGERANLHLL